MPDLYDGHFFYPYSPLLLNSFQVSVMLEFSEFSKLTMGFPDGSVGRESMLQGRRLRRCGFNPWVRKIPPRGGNGNPAQYSCMKNPMDRGAWRASIQRVAKSQTELNSGIANLDILTHHGEVCIFFPLPTTCCNFTHSPDQIWSSYSTSRPNQNHLG